MKVAKLSRDQLWLAEALDALDRQDTETLDRLGCPLPEGARQRLWRASREVATAFALLWQHYHKAHCVARTAIFFGHPKSKKRPGRGKAVGGAALPDEVYQRLLDSLEDLRGLWRGLTTFCAEVSIDPQKLLAWVRPHVPEVGRGPDNEREMLGLDDDTKPLNLDLGYKTYSFLLGAWAAVQWLPAPETTAAK